MSLFWTMYNVHIIKGRKKLRDYINVWVRDLKRLEYNWKTRFMSRTLTVCTNSILHSKELFFISFFEHNYHINTAKTRENHDTSFLICLSFQLSFFFLFGFLWACPPPPIVYLVNDFPCSSFRFGGLNRTELIFVDGVGVYTVNLTGQVIFINE